MASRMLELAIEAARRAKAAGNLGAMLGPVEKFITSYEAAQRLGQVGGPSIPRSASAAEQELRSIAQESHGRRLSPEVAEERLERIAQLIQQVRQEARLDPGRLATLARIEQLIRSRAPMPMQAATREAQIEDNIKQLGRGQFGYDKTGYLQQRRYPEDPQQRQRLEDLREARGEEEQITLMTPESSNVYSYTYDPELKYGANQTTVSRRGQHNRGGIIYVTFKLWTPGQKGDRPNVAGPTYAYYDVPEEKYESFASAISPSGKGAGVAVWDYLRVRGSVHQHQHPYRLVGAAYVPVGSHLGGHLVQERGVYVPRKATARGFATRNLPGQGAGRRGYTRSQLPPSRRPGEPNRGVPNTGRR